MSGAHEFDTAEPERSILLLLELLPLILQRQPIEVEVQKSI